MAAETRRCQSRCMAAALASAIFVDVATRLALRRAVVDRACVVPRKPFKEARMNIRMLPIIVLAMVLSLAGCEEEENGATETEEVEEVED
jgi:hypothetical protein